MHSRRAKLKNPSSSPKLRKQTALLPPEHRISHDPVRPTPIVFFQPSSANRNRSSNSAHRQPQAVSANARLSSLAFSGGSGEGVGKIAGSAFAEVLAGCGAFEWVALGYLALSSVLIVIFSQNLRIHCGAQRAGAGRLHDCGACRAEANVLERTSKSRIEEFGNCLGHAYSHAYSEVLAFLAALVSAPFLFILF